MINKYIINYPPRISLLSDEYMRENKQKLLTLSGFKGKVSCLGYSPETSHKCTTNTQIHSY